jgi:putative component of membrane protein insertase Oxa1/YidC/SpoIIIJ protein YidD
MGLVASAYVLNIGTHLKQHSYFITTYLQFFRLLRCNVPICAENQNSHKYDVEN